ncbi:hypothetical protein [uncultured Nitratireductor sp.]|uniref:hypothetical protein n=1 Tax=uncultured Nitratireductor sp. TaxID=520953 RepID=UPI0025FDF59C|nr:hypothetical protein [uncultured Nitratireductor sp.]
MNTSRGKAGRSGCPKGAARPLTNPLADTAWTGGLKLLRGGRRASSDYPLNAGVGAEASDDDRDEVGAGDCHNGVALDDFPNEAVWDDAPTAVAAADREI